MSIGSSWLFIFLSAAFLGARGSNQPIDPDTVPKQLAQSDWQSIRAAYEAGRHAFQPVEGGWQARNPGQQWTMKFDGRGFTAEPRDGAWQWGLELQSYGFPGAERAVDGEAVVKADGQRLTYDWNAAVQEWFLNDQRGLEHGFTIRQRPEDSFSQSSLLTVPLTLTLATRGTLYPHVSDDAQSVAFQDVSGATVLNYSGLKVWDADGNVLASRFDPAGDDSVRLLVEERGARYPLTIDPIARQAYLKAHQVNAGDWFGVSVAVSGDTVVVGAFGESSSTTGVNSTPDESAPGAGAAYVFVRNGTTWTQQAYLKAPRVSIFDFFGRSVSVSGDTVVVGSYGEDSSTIGINSTPNSSAPHAGAAYVFVRDGTNWTQQAYLKAHQVNGGDAFGWSVSVSGDTVVAGAQHEAGSRPGVNNTPNESAVRAGAAYVFVRNGTAWTQQAYLKAHQVSAEDQFGYSVAVSGDTVVVGAPFESSGTTGVNTTPNEGVPFSGAAYVFMRSGTAWTQQAYLKAHQVSGSDWLGKSVAVSGDTVVVGATNDDSSMTGINSMPNEDALSAGAACVFVRNGTNWVQSAYLKAPQVSPGDEFGAGVAVSDGTVVVGAWLEDSNTTGINTTPNESAPDAGAAYVFTGLDPSPDADGDGLQDSWELTHWPTIINHSAQDDFDGDGYVELLELALGLNPKTPDPGGLPPVTSEGGYLTMTLTKQPGVIYEVQSAGTLREGQPDSFSPASTTVLLDDATTLKVRDNTLIGTAPRRFLRVKVTAAP